MTKIEQALDDKELDEGSEEQLEDQWRCRDCFPPELGSRNLNGLLRLNVETINNKNNKRTC